eukprot:8153410-Heterocapsa_arctica.AAC.1
MLPLRPRGHSAPKCRPGVQPQRDSRKTVEFSAAHVGANAAEEGRSGGGATDNHSTSEGDEAGARTAGR